MKIDILFLLVWLGVLGCRETTNSEIDADQVNASDFAQKGMVLRGVKVLQNLETRELCTAFHITKWDLITAGHCLRKKNKVPACRIAINGEVKEALCFVAQYSSQSNDLLDSIYDLGLIHLKYADDDPTIFEKPSSGVSRLKDTFRFGISGFGRVSDSIGMVNLNSGIQMDKNGYQHDELGADMTGISDKDMLVNHPGILCEGMMNRDDLHEITTGFDNHGFIISPDFMSLPECIPRDGASGSPFFDSELNLIGVAASRVSSKGRLLGIYLVRMDSSAFEDVLKQVLSL